MDSGKAVENSQYDRYEWRKQREYPGFNSPGIKLGYLVNGC